VFRPYTLLMQLDSILRAITPNRSSGWKDTALDWLIAAVVVGVACAGLMIVWKMFLKQKARNIKERVWRRSKTVKFILVGLAPVLLVTFFVWYMSRDFYNVIAVGGLFKGILFSWVLYLFLMLIGHAWGEWRRDIF